jgi:hypothetical protein
MRVGEDAPELDPIRPHAGPRRPDASRSAPREERPRMPRRSGAGSASRSRRRQQLSRATRLATASARAGPGFTRPGCERRGVIACMPPEESPPPAPCRRARARPRIEAACSLAVSAAESGRDVCERGCPRPGYRRPRIHSEAACEPERIGRPAARILPPRPSRARPGVISLASEAGQRARPRHPCPRREDAQLAHAPATSPTSAMTAAFPCIARFRLHRRRPLARIVPSARCGRERSSYMSAIEAVALLVATPIGNLGDISCPARETLAAASAVAAEDTRTQRKALPRARARATARFPARAQRARARRRTRRRLRGESIALVSAPARRSSAIRLPARRRGDRGGITVTPEPGAIAPRSPRSSAAGALPRTFLVSKDSCLARRARRQRLAEPPRSAHCSC